MKVRTDAAKALMPYIHGKVGEQGKKASKDDAAKEATGRFTPPAPVRCGLSAVSEYEMDYGLS